MLRAFAGGRLFGSRTGSGAPRVLALHGWARTHSDFTAVLTPAAAGDARPSAPIDAVALDLPGFGATPHPPGAWGSPEYAAAVAEVLPELDVPVVLLGHSFGGRVAVHLAAAHPEQVRALVLTGVPLAPHPDHRARPPAAYRAVRALHRGRLVGERRMEAARQRHGSSDYRNADGVMRGVLVATVAERYEAQLAAIDCPVRLVWGDDDTTAPLAGAETAAALLPRAQLTVCPGAGHLTPLTVPGVLRRAVLEALA